MPEKPTYEELEQRVRELEHIEADWEKVNQRLTESESYQRALMDAVPDSLFLMKTDGTMIVVNAGLAGNFNSTVLELTGKNTFDLVPAEIALSRKAAVEETVNSGKSHTFYDTRFDRYIESRLFPIKDNLGRVSHVAIFGRDVTERKKIEEALARRLEFERIVSEISSVLAGMSSKEQIDAEINHALASIGDFSSADRAYVFLYSKDERIVDNTHEWCNDNILPEIENLQGISIDEELPWFAKQIKGQEVVYVPDVLLMPSEARLEQQHFSSQEIKSLIVVPMKLGDRMIGFLGFDAVREKRKWNDDDLILLRLVGETFARVIERNQTEEALKEKSDFLDKVIESSALSTWVSDEKGTAIRINTACLKLFGAAGEEVIGKYNLFRDSVLREKGYTGTIRDVFEKGKPASIYVDYDFAAVDHVSVKNATHRVVNSIFTPILDDENKVTNVIVQIIDLTDIKRMEEELNQSRKMESIGTLAGGIAHEFNNILGIILGNAELAIDDISEDIPAFECLHEIRKASLRAKDVVRHIMSFARKTPADRKPILIGNTIKESLKLIRATVPKSIEINQNICRDSELILGNPTEISQIIMNLFSNSIHAIKEEIGTIDVMLRPVFIDNKPVSEYEDIGAGDYIKLTVRDTGAGIDPAIMDRILDPYFTTKDVDEGLGMGLAVVYGIVKKHDGAVKVMSKLGKGTTVEILFPAIKADPGDDAKKSKILPTGTERVLLVDDEPALVKMATEILVRQGYKVVGMTESTEALKMLAGSPDDFDILITDMAMPEMTGDQLVRKVLKVRPDIPVILTTGHSDRMDEVEAIKLGVNALTVKPLQREEFVMTVRKVLNAARLKRAG